MNDDKENRLFRWLVERLPSGVVALNKEGGVVYANPAATELLERDVEELAERGLQGVFDGATPPVEISSLLSGGERWMEVCLSDGRWLSVHIIHFGTDGLASILILADVTAFRLLEEMKTSFLTDSLHLIKTPLTTVSSALSLVNARHVGDLPEKTRKLISVSMSETRRLVSVLNAIREMLLVESGLIEEDLVIEPVALQLLFESAHKDIAKISADADAKIEISTPDSVPSVMADRERLRWVLGELFTNSLRYLAEDGKVCLSAEDRGGQIAIIVRDEGKGMDEEELARAFKQQFRALNEENRKTGGAGLGLHVVKGLVEAMGGDVTIDGAPGKGCTVEILLPGAVYE